MRLVILDTTQIQPFVFGSNRLRENVGASYLVAQATGAWALDLLPQPNNVAQADPPEFNNDSVLTGGKIAAQVVYAGGGNVVVLFQKPGDADAYVRRLTEKTLLEAPGLQLVACQTEYDKSDDNSLYSAVQDGFRDLAKRKGRLERSEPLLGVGVTRACQSTGLPAVGFSPSFRDEKPYPVSLAVEKKQGARKQGDTRLRKMLDPGEDYAYPTEFADLGSTVGEFSYIAVVHIDGNGMGKRIREIGKDRPDDKYVDAIGSFSRGLNRSGCAALKKTIDRLKESVDSKESAIAWPAGDLDKAILKIPLNREDDGTIVLPIRPIVYGGDDVTFVCDGRIGIALALECVRQFEIQTEDLPDKKGKACACAGVAIVKSHYPFARAYALAEQLCGNAKHYVRSCGIETSAIDWHFATSGLSGGLEDIRVREFEVPAGSLLLRPVLLGEHPRDLRTWATIERGIKEFRKDTWLGRRNKIKALREALRGGPAVVEAFSSKYFAEESNPLPDLGRADMAYRSKGWLGPADDLRAAYFDIIELNDWYIPLTTNEVD